MDSVISISGQSLVDGLTRLLGPALDQLKAPIPVSIPGLSNATLNIRNILPGDTGVDRLQLKIVWELAGEVPVLVNVPATSLELTSDLSLADVTGTLSVPDDVKIPLAGISAETIGDPTDPSVPGLTLDLQSLALDLPQPPHYDIQLDNIQGMFTEPLTNITLSGPVGDIGTFQLPEQTNVIAFSNPDPTEPSGTVVPDVTDTPPWTATLQPASGLGAITGNLSLDLDGDLDLSQLLGNLSLDNLTGNLRIPGIDLPAVPLPAVVSIPLDLTAGTPVETTVALLPRLNNSELFTVDIDEASGFGVEFTIRDVGPVAVDLPTNLVDTLENVLKDALEAAQNQLLNLDPIDPDQDPSDPDPDLIEIPQPALNLGGIELNGEHVPGVVAVLKGQIEAALNETIRDVVASLTARTGRLVNAEEFQGASCPTRVLPRFGKARLQSGTGGPMILQMMFGRSNLDVDPFPSITPTPGLLEARVDLDNSFVLDLLVCLIQQHHGISFSTAPQIDGLPPRATWNRVTVSIGPFALTGTLTLLIEGTGVNKRISLEFDLGSNYTHTASHPQTGLALNLFNLDIGVRWKTDVSLQLTNLTAVTNLQFAGTPAPEVRVIIRPTFAGVIAFLVATGLVIAPYLVTYYPGVVAPWAGLEVVGTVAILIGAAAMLTAGLIKWLLSSAAVQVLNPLRGIESPAGVPSGVFDAFGEFLPSEMVLDDLTATGVLSTPVSGWSPLPLSASDNPRR